MWIPLAFPECILRSRSPFHGSAMLYLSILDYRKEADALRSAYEMDGEERARREKRIRKESGNTPLLLLITCTRIEAYSTDRPVSFESMERAFSLNHIRSMDKRRNLSDVDAIRHFYTLSLGIESPLFGEELILSQIKEARERAIRNRSASSYLLRLSQDVISFAKEMHSKHKIRVFDDGIGKALAERIDRGKKILIIGSGELSRLVAAALVKNGCSVTMTLRDITKTFLLVPGGMAISYDERRDRVGDYDVVISSSSGIYHTFEESDGPLLEGKELYDLAEPYDIPSSLHPVRLRDLNVRMEERDTLVTLLNSEIDKRISFFEKDMEMRKEALKAEDFSISVLRRMNPVIDELLLDMDKRKGLEDALYDCVRKAYIETERKSRKR